MQVPHSIQEVTESWLSSVLGGSVRIEAIAPIGKVYGLASDRFRLVLSGWSNPSIVVKLWSFEGPADATEAHFYRSMANSMGIPIPRCHHAGSDESHGALVLEDLSNTRQGDVLVPESLDRLELLATVLATFHARWWGGRELSAYGWLRDTMPGPSPEWFADRRRRLSDRGYRPPDDFTTTLIGVAERLHARGTALVSAHPPTLIHGDLHLDNILFRRDEPFLLDWARCGLGPGPHDLVSVLYSMSRPADIDAIVKAYRLSLASNGVRISGRTLWDLIVGASLRSFVYWTLGTATWVPADRRTEALWRKTLADAERMMRDLAGRAPVLFEALLS